MSTVTEAPVARRSTRTAKKASKAGYWIALGVLIIGVAAAAVWGVGSVDDANDQAGAFPRATVPGTATINVTEPGDQMVYFTGSGDPSAESLGLQVQGPDGVSVPTTPYSLALEVDLAGNVGTAMATFAADSPGAYSVTSTGSYPGGAISVGDNVAMDVLPHVVGAVTLMFLSAVAAGAIAIITLLRRSSRVQ
jgi:hypothetical protein